VCARLNIPPGIEGAAWLDFQCDEFTVLGLRPDEMGITCGLELLLLIGVPVLLVVPSWYAGEAG